MSEPKAWDGKPLNPQFDGEHWVVPLDEEHGDPVIVKWTAADGWEPIYQGLEGKVRWEGWAYVMPYEVPEKVWVVADALRGLPPEEPEAPEEPAGPMGMELRDWFASLSMACAWITGKYGHLTRHGQAEVAYATADAMLAERAKRREVRS